MRRATLSCEVSVYIAEMHAISMVISVVGEEIDHTKLRMGSRKFCCIPGPVEVKSNEEADRTAVSTAARAEEFIGVDYQDWYSLIRKKVKQHVARSGKLKGRS